jgi:hypothetical protein
MNTNLIIESSHYAYARGYYDGRAIGVESNPYSGVDSEFQEYLFYQRGFRDGVSDFRNLDKDGK